MVEFKFETQDLTNFRPKQDEPQTLGDIRFRQCLSTTQWYALPPAVRARFGKRVRGGESKIYKGHITKNKMSPLGYALAQLFRLIGAPLPIEKNGIGAPAIVTVTEDKDGQGQFWTRQYGRTHTFPQVIKSSKRFGGPTGMEEYIGYGIGMTLRLDVVCDALIFRQERYFIEAFGHRFYLPNWMTPGELTVTHKNMENDWFEFGLTLKHALFGTLLEQCAHFRDIET
jgi:hypothetical protein